MRTQRFEYWLQELRDNVWVDYAKKDDLIICRKRLKELEIEKPKRIFRVIVRKIVDENI